MENFIRSATFLFVLLNPFLLSIYLMDLIRDFPMQKFVGVILRGMGISMAVFVVFACLGDAVFTKILGVRFESFLIFGGIIFLIVGIQFFFEGTKAMRGLRGSVGDPAVVVAVPYTIGPGTVSASILAGSRLPLILAVLAIVLTLTVTTVAIILMKSLHDYVSDRNEKIVERYIDIVGRAMALLIGTFAVEMIMQGISAEIESLP
ncbi:MAG: MarC family protein [Coleofasciculaceae cyanobacterium SM2_3_26]|nr:MarC family protein [Coleofasciculaceae cyanobacterium SM2_3_26]